MKVPALLGRAAGGFCTAFASLLLTGCGGGGGGSSQAPPTIQAILAGLPSGTAPPAGFANAMVTVTDSTSGLSVTNATVTMNGAPLTYNSQPSRQEYEGTLDVAPGAAITLAVRVGDSSYTASATQFTTYPTLVEPASGDEWSPLTGHPVSWTGGAPLANALYLLGLVDALDPDGASTTFQAFSPGTLQTTLLGGQSRGPWGVLLGIVGEVPVAHASDDSSFIYGGFDYVPVTVYTWTPRTYGSGVLRGLAWSGAQFAGVGLAGFDGLVYTSPDAVNWTARTFTGAPAADLRAVTWAGGRFVAVGDGTTATSPDAVTWTALRPGVPMLYGVAGSGSVYAAVGSQGAICTSPDGLTWTARTAGTQADLEGIAWAGTQFITVGQDGTILTSPDGGAWTARVSHTSNNLTAVTWSGSAFVAAGEQGTVLTSPDGVAWTVENSGIFSPIYSVTWAGTRFVAVGYGGGIWTSPDGATWKAQTANIVNNLYAAAWDGTQVVAIGDSTILTSP